MIFSCKDIKLSFGATEVLKNINFHVAARERVALVGVNGAGKTTLFKIILGELTADSGEIMLVRGTRLGYLAQNMDLGTQNTIIDELMSVFAHLEQLYSQAREIETQMAGLDGAELEKAMSRYQKLIDDYEKGGGYEYKSRVRGVLAGLGFKSVEHDLAISKLSGGQKTRVALGKLLLSQPDLLLLDEPTNHLDIKAASWLEDYLAREFNGAVLVISHDRYFLDKVVKKVVEIERGVAKSYKGDYTAFVEQKAKDFEVALHQFESQQKQIEKQQASIDLLKSFNREKSLKRARSKEKNLAKIERLEAPKSAPNPMRLALTPHIESGNDVLKIENGKKVFGETTLFSGINLQILKGEKVALIGENGVGKTTLFKMMLEGDKSVFLGRNVKIGYYDQTLAFDDLEKTIFNEISDAHPRLKNVEIRSVLAAFLFVGDDVFKPISALSGGERGRVALAKLMLSDINFLMLDEPTNHLDLFSKEILENAVNTYAGTVLYISHDRYFINNTADRVIELTANGATQYLGNYDYYIEKKAQLAPDVQATQEKPADSANKLSYLEQKEAASKLRQQKARITKLESEIEQTENKIALQDELLANPDVATDATLANEAYTLKASLESQLEKLLNEWEELQS